MITKENIIDILYVNSYSVQDQAGNNLIVVDDDDWGKVADAIIALGNPTYGAKYKIRKGDKFLCLKDYVMNDGSVAYRSGKTYISEEDDHIKDEDGTTPHDMSDQNDFFEYFKPFAMITNVVVAGIDMADAPDFVDAYIESADLDGVPMTEEQLDALSEDYDFVYGELIKQLY